MARAEKRRCLRAGALATGVARWRAPGHGMRVERGWVALHYPCHDPVLVRVVSVSYVAVTSSAV